MTKSSATLLVRGSLVERNIETGIIVYGSSATFETTVVRDTRANPAGDFGDGILCYTLPGRPDLRASATVLSSAATHNARTGISVFGADLSFSGSQLGCNLGGDLDQEPLGPPPIDPGVVDGGRNLCGCKGALATCVPQTASLEPPPSPPER